MKFIRRLMGTLVMIAGIIGLLISLSGLVGVWMARPVIAASVNSTITTLSTSIDTSQKAMTVTGQALNATVASVDALSDMLGNTAISLENTQPVLVQLNAVMGVTLPDTLETATESLETAQQAAASLEGAIKSLDTFRMVMASAPLIGGLVDAPDQPFNPEKPLADSLGDLAVSLQNMPKTFSEMSVNLDKADDNLDAIKDNLTTMSVSVEQISASLREYESMVGESQQSMEDLHTVLTNVQTNLPGILNGAAMVFTLFFLWLLAAQIVIFSQGLELYRGTATHMEAPAE